ncbi:hypothetical protein L2E82_24483 [Cichorium intybus]|uniref:Uncharacterized protein n=1 Tax=Cichorium intybus TaxID=13427 RepID=A0ACB9E161_CICIN|nr:hypothetical protein L2E82_24483 [Cichorium intybus]
MIQTSKLLMIQGIDSHRINKAVIMHSSFTTVQPYNTIHSLCISEQPVKALALFTGITNSEIECRKLCEKSRKEEEGGCHLLIRKEIDSSPLVQRLVERKIKVAGTITRTMN